MKLLDVIFRPFMRLNDSEVKAAMRIIERGGRTRKEAMKLWEAAYLKSLNF